MLHRAFTPLLMIAFLNIGCASASGENLEVVSDQNCTFERGIGDGKIGPIRLGDSLRALRQNYQVETTFLPYSDAEGHAVLLCGGEATIIAEVDDAGAVITLSTSSTSFETQRGAAVVMSLDKLQALHPEVHFRPVLKKADGLLSALMKSQDILNFRWNGFHSNAVRMKRHAAMS